MRGTLAFVALLMAPLAPANAPDTASSASTLEEARVEARRTRLSEIRREMIQLEDRFYARYNELNTNDDFDIHCENAARTGTRLERRYCQPVYETEAQREEGIEYFHYLYRSMTDEAFKFLSKNDGGLIGGPPPPALQKIEARRPEFRQTMLEVTRDNPELVQLLAERQRIAKRYEAARRKLFGRNAPDQQP